jgi:hypothetical protein
MFPFMMDFALLLCLLMFQTTAAAKYNGPQLALQ